MEFGFSNRKSTFAWQALLILLPVIVLAVLGFLSLRQDKALAEVEATQRAQAVATDLLSMLRAELLSPPAAGQTNSNWLVVSDDGELVFPSPVGFPPVPPRDNADRFNERQNALWAGLEAADSAPTTNVRSRATIVREFIASNPSTNLAAAAWYSLGLLEYQQRPEEAATAFREILLRYPDALGETGLPFCHLAAFKLLQQDPAKPGNLRAIPLGSRPLSWESFCQALVEEPSPVSGYLLERAISEAGAAAQPACKMWKRVWEKDEVLRCVYQSWRAGVQSIPPLASISPASKPSLLMPRLAWVRLPEGRGSDPESSLEEPNWLITRVDGPSTNSAPPQPRGVGKSTIFLCWPEYELGSNLAAIVSTLHSIPDYFGVGIEIGGQPVTHSAPDLRIWSRVPYSGKGGGIHKGVSPDPATKILASAGGTSDDELKVKVYLTSPATLFERQAARKFWFGALIGAAGLAAVIGLASAWRAFHRQQQLSEMKSNFVSSVSHELRAPIASVRLLAESLDLGKIQEPARQREYFRFIVQECRRLSGLIENVLNFSRIEQGRKQYEFEPTDVLALLRQTVAVVEPYAADHGVGVTLALPEPAGNRGEVQSIIDGKAIQQALINLADNAIKHSPKGETVTIGVEFPAENPSPSAAAGSAGDGVAVRFWVEDRGEGIPAAEHQKIFERFYRIGSELRRETTGVGIGLSIVQHIVEAHHGSIQVRSAPGEGSRFTIELPAGPGSALPSAGLPQTASET
jgi:signal transduction histidine kinase